VGWRRGDVLVLVLVLAMVMVVMALVAVSSTHDGRPCHVANSVLAVSDLKLAVLLMLLERLDGLDGTGNFRLYRINTLSEKAPSEIREDNDCNSQSW